jgi:glutaredoxin
MEKNNFSFEFIDVDLLEGKEREEVINEGQSYCPGCGYPIIVVDDTVIRGFDEPRLIEVLGL